MSGRGNWVYSGINTYRYIIGDHVARTLDSSNEEEFAFHLANLVAIARPWVEDDDVYSDELTRAKERLDGGKPTTAYRHELLGIVMTALKRHGMLAAAQIDEDDEADLDNVAELQITGP